MDSRHFFQQLGLDEKTTDVLLNVIRLGAQPASVIANHAKLDRTTTYRILKTLARKKFIVESKRKSVTVFYLDKLSDISHFIEKQKKHLETMSREFEYILPELSSMRSSAQELPKIQIYEGHERLDLFFRDVVSRAREQHLLLIRILGSNTFFQQLERKEMGEIIIDFQKDLEKNVIESEILIAQGNLTREWLTQLHTFKAMANLPAAGGATNVILVGESIFMVSFRDFPVAIRIDHPDMAQTMHFLFDMSKAKI
ncbi:hypothetical protein HYV57_03685 [Candidatus Peregrinibacteria bacterium]|nr:hypothetical protein [Candidatus Peregrinibacteria bacterium]